MTAGLVIVGGSHAGAQIAAWSREVGFEEPILLVSEEDHAPYQRPPLSKGLLLGTATEADLALRGESFYRESAIELMLGCRVAAIDRQARVVSLTDGRHLRYDRLALCTGARVRRLSLPGAELDGICYLRSLADAQALRQRLAGCAEAVVVGGGFIGLEIAAVLAQLGKTVTVIEAQDRLMARAVGGVVGEFFRDRHARAGVRIRLRTGVSAFAGSGGRLSHVVTDGGERIGADIAIVGVGVMPNQELAAAAGLACDDGIVVDRFARTTDPLILAAGDCSRHPSAYAGRPLRLESVQNAVDQAKTAAATLVGEEAPHDAVPWFWSDQFELKLQMVGLGDGHDAHAIRGSVGDESFSVFYFRQGDLVSIDSINRPSDHMIGRKLLARRAALTPAQAADESFDLKALLA